MKRYAPSHPRARFAMIATALAALNFAVLVALPASLEASGHGVTLAASDEPHVDSGARALEGARAARGRRPDLVARAAGIDAPSRDRLFSNVAD